MSASEFKARCLKVMDEISRTRSSLIVTKRGRPIAQIGPPPSLTKRTTAFGALRLKAHIVGDLETPVHSAADWRKYEEAEFRRLK